VRRAALALGDGFMFLLLLPLRLLDDWQMRQQDSTDLGFGQRRRP
jgi:hypothetical protein